MYGLVALLAPHAVLHYHVGSVAPPQCLEQLVATIIETAVEQDLPVARACFRACLVGGVGQRHVFLVHPGGRRIKRHILIRANSVRFIHENEIEDLTKIQLIADYLKSRQADINKWNSQHGIDKSLSINGRNLTNLGIFRKYINSYIETHPGANKELTIMCRHLQPTEKGIPIEIYLFTSDKRWLNYEYIMADIFDHIIASVAYFGLEIFELPSGKGYIEE